jgi:hypothetical protein
MAGGGLEEISKKEMFEDAREALLEGAPQERAYYQGLASGWFRKTEAKKQICATGVRTDRAVYAGSTIFMDNFEKIERNMNTLRFGCQRTQYQTPGCLRHLFQDDRGVLLDQTPRSTRFTPSTFEGGLEHESKDS